MAVRIPRLRHLVVDVVSLVGIITPPAGDCRNGLHCHPLRRSHSARRVDTIFLDVMVAKMTDAERARVVVRWRRAAAHMSQEEFVAELRREQGIGISTRTLRSWCNRFGGTANAEHVERARGVVEEALRKVVEAGERLRAALTDLDAQQDVRGAAGTALDDSPIGAGSRSSPTRKASFFSDLSV